MPTPDPVSALVLSLQVGLWCVVLAAVPATAVAYVFARREFPLKTIAVGVVLAPLTLPPVVTGFLLLKVFGPASPIGGLLESAGLSVAFSLRGAVLAALVVSTPLFVLLARAAFEAVDQRTEELARTLGHGRLATFRKVTLPVALPGLLGGAILMFVRAIGEFGATLMLAGNEEGKTRTLALAVSTLADQPGGTGAMATLVLVSLATSVAALAGSELLQARIRARRGA